MGPYKFKPMTNPTPLIRVYVRNMELEGFKRGWNSTQLANKLGISANTFRRLRSGANRYICAELLQTAMSLFKCTPDNLLLPKDGIDYNLE